MAELAELQARVRHARMAFTTDLFSFYARAYPESDI
jgi:hypothetical protein